MAYYTEFRTRRVASDSLNARLLDKRVDIEAPPAARDDAGQPLDGEAWVPVAKGIPARIRPLSGGEMVAAASVQSQASIEVTLRYRPGITAAMRLVYEGRHLTITDRPMNVDEANRWLILRCSEGLQQR